MKRFVNSFMVLAFVLMIVKSATAQSTNAISFYATGGLKTNNFKQILKAVSASNTSPGYNENQISPKVENTVSFFAGVAASKPLNKRFSLSNTLALDMQQLDITSGFQKQSTVSGITVYGTTTNADLLARLKLDFGIHYNLITHNDSKLSLGLLAGQMIAVSNRTNSYSFTGATLRFEHKQHAVFVSGTLTPYRTKIRNLENYVGNINAELVIAEYAYRIHEVNVGYAIRL